MNMPCELCTDPDGAAGFPPYGRCSTPMGESQEADGFTPDPDAPGLGTWWCIHCGHGKPAEAA